MGKGQKPYTSCIQCGLILGTRNKYGFCDKHRHLSPERKAQRKIIQANRYLKYSDEEKAIMRQKTKKYKDSKRDLVTLVELNYIRSLTDEEKTRYFKNKKKIYNAIYEKKRKQEDIGFKVAKNIRSRLSKALTTNQKSGSAVSDLGCTIEELKAYLESKFQLGMTWENYGLKGWHIDHIKPLCYFNLNITEQFLEACHYSNLQPLWWEDNLGKISKDKEIKNGKQVDEENFS